MEKKNYLVFLTWCIAARCQLMIVYLHVDPAVLLAEESSKPPCRQFFSTGELEQ